MNVFVLLLSFTLSYLIHRHSFATFSYVAETFIYLYVGMDAMDIEKWRFVCDRYVQYSLGLSF